MRKKRTAWNRLQIAQSKYCAGDGSKESVAKAKKAYINNAGKKAGVGIKDSKKKAAAMKKAEMSAKRSAAKLTKTCKVKKKKK